MLRLHVDGLHLRQLRQRAQLLRKRRLLHLPDGEMHPQERDGDDAEQEHEAARPHTRHVEKRTEGDRQDEASEAADHADQAADRPHMVGIVDRDVLVDRGLAERHEEAEHEDQHDERHQAEAGREGDRPAYAVDDVVGVGIGQHEGHDGRHAEGPVHDPPGAVLVGQMAAIGAEDRGGNGIERRDHAGGLDVEFVDADEIARQPERQRDEGAEDEEVVDREAPHLQVLQRFELQECTFRLPARRPARLEVGVVVRREPEHDGDDHEDGGPGLRDDGPAEGDHHEWRDELGHRGADISGAENPERGALLLLRIPLRDVGHADSEGTARKPDAQRGNQHHFVGRGIGQGKGRRRRSQHREHVDDAAAILIGPDAEEYARQRACQDRRSGKQAELRVGKAEILFDLDADDGEDGPDGKARGKGQRAHSEYL